MAGFVPLRWTRSHFAKCFATHTIVAVLGAGITGGAPASADTPSGETSSASPEDARTAADAARRAADDARRRLEQAQRDLDAAVAGATRKAEEAAELEAEAEAAEAKSEAEAAAAEAAQREAARTARDAEQRAAQADERAQEAERKASEALDRVKELESRFGYDRTGLYVGAGVYYAPEAFDEGNGVVAKSSRGAMGRVGYRFHRNVAFEARFDYFEDFDLSTDVASAELEAYAITGNVRVFPYPKRLQPWLSLGAGAIHTKFDARFDDGRKINTKGKETDPIFRFGAGFDLYLTTYLVLNIEAAMNIVTDERDWVDYGQLGAGVDFRF